MKKIAYFMATVAGVLTSLFSHAAKAACDTYYYEWDENHEDPQFMECGQNCCYRITEDDENGRGSVIIYADVEGEEAVFEDAYSSTYSATYMGAKDIVFSEGITKITSAPYGYSSGFTVYLPDSLKEVSPGVFYDSSVDAYVFSDNIDTSGWDEDAFGYDRWYWDEVNIKCAGDLDTCKEKFANIRCTLDWDDDIGDYVNNFCSEYVQLASEEYCKGVNYHWSDGKCEYIGGSAYNDIGEDEEHINCGEGKLEKDGICVSAAQGCGEGYRQFETWCNKVRWTPAEAAEKLTDDNNNSVTITFKK